MINFMESIALPNILTHGFLIAMELDPDTSQTLVTMYENKVTIVAVFTLSNRTI